MQTKKDKKIRRHRKIRTKMHGTSKAPRLCVSRSIRHIYGQVIDDDKAKIILSVSDAELKSKKIKKTEAAREVGKLIAKKALEKKIEKVVFDRGGALYHGRIKALAEGAREGGLKF